MIYLLLGALVIVVMLVLAYVSLFVGGHAHARADDVGRSRRLVGRVVGEGRRRRCRHEVAVSGPIDLGSAPPRHRARSPPAPAAARLADSCRRPGGGPARCRGRRGAGLSDVVRGVGRARGRGARRRRGVRVFPGRLPPRPRRPAARRVAGERIRALGPRRQSRLSAVRRRAAGQCAAAIGEADEEERCALFLRQLDPAWPPARRLERGDRVIERAGRSPVGVVALFLVRRAGARSGDDSGQQVQSWATSTGSRRQPQHAARRRPPRRHDSTHAVDTTALHTDCDVLVNDALSANQNLPTPDGTLTGSCRTPTSAAQAGRDCAQSGAGGDAGLLARASGALSRGSAPGYVKAQARLDAVDTTGTSSCARGTRSSGPSRRDGTRTPTTGCAAGCCGRCRAGCTWSARAPAARRNLMTISWVTQVAMTPSSWASGSRRARVTHELLEEGGVFALSLLPRRDRRPRAPLRQAGHRRRSSTTAGPGP